MLERQAPIVEESAEALYHLFVLGEKCIYLATYIQCDLLGVGHGPKIRDPWCSGRRLRERAGQSQIRWKQNQHSEHPPVNHDGKRSLRVAIIHTIHTKTEDPQALGAVPNCWSHLRSLDARYSEGSGRGCL